MYFLVNCPKLPLLRYMEAICTILGPNETNREFLSKFLLIKLFLIIFAGNLGQSYKNGEEIFLVNTVSSMF